MKKITKHDADHNDLSIIISIIYYLFFGFRICIQINDILKLVSCCIHVVSIQSITYLPKQI